MIKLICKSCGETWYTANTSPNQKCSDCGGVLVEDNNMLSKLDTKDIDYNNSKSKVISLDSYSNTNI